MTSEERIKGSAWVRMIESMLPKINSNYGNKNMRVSKEEIDKVNDLCSQGKSISYISKTLGISTAIVKYRIAKGKQFGEKNG